MVMTPSWVFPVVAAGTVIGAFGLGMWLLGQPEGLGAFAVPPDTKRLLRQYRHVIDAQVDPSGKALVWFRDRSGKVLAHDWFWDGSDWRCGLTGEISTGEIQ
jgi:hypothetical protein